MECGSSCIAWETKQPRLVPIERWTQMPGRRNDPVSSSLQKPKHTPSHFQRGRNESFRLPSNFAIIPMRTKRCRFVSQPLVSALSPQAPKK